MSPKKRGKSKKINPPKVTKLELIETLPFHIMFPITLIHKDGTSTKTCYFQHESHLKKYIIRNKLKPKQCKITDTEPRNSNEAI